MHPWENDSTAVGRAGAAQGLHVAGGPEAFAALRKAMLKDSEGVVRGAAAAAAVGFIIDSTWQPRITCLSRKTF